MNRHLRTCTHSLKFLFTFTLFFISTLSADHQVQKLPVDISFVIVDFKYNAVQGIKICEVQQSSISDISFTDQFPDTEVVNYEKSIYSHIKKHFDKIWFSDISDIYNKKLAEIFDKNHVRVGNSKFVFNATQAPMDPYDLSTYQGAYYTKVGQIEKLGTFLKKNPGVVVIDAATAPFWMNKEKMSQLFTKNTELSQFKPSWHSYQKKYSSNLAKTICEDIPGNSVVIKPLSSLMGNGVIIVKKEVLDKTLRLILTNKKMLRKISDVSYYYWSKDKSKSFIVEEFIESDPVIASLLDNLPYDGTLRAVCGLEFNMNKITIQIFGMHWKLPKKSLLEEGSMNDLHKNFPRRTEDRNVPVKREIQEQIKIELNHALTLLYQEMLGLKTLP